MFEPLIASLRGFARRRAIRVELDEEMQFHLEQQIAAHVRRGLSPTEAARRARLEFGGLAQTREAVGDVRATWLDDVTVDVQHALGTMRKAPLWTLVVTTTLALGIGLSTAIFGVVYGVLLKPLPYPNADRLVAIWNSAPGAYQRFNVSGLNWLTWRDRSRSFDDIALARVIANFNLTGSGTPERLQGARASSNLFRVLAVEPLAGRVFTEEEQNSDAKVAVLSYGLWQRRFGGEPDIVGRKILLNGAAHEVIGVMPKDFEYPTTQFELWTPLYVPPDELQPGLNNNYVAVGRLQSNVSVAQAQADMSRLAQQFAQEHPETRLAMGGYVDARVEPLLESNTIQIRTALWVLLAAVSCVLLIGCLNLGILLIARANARTREMAIRAALGASAGRLQRQMLAEAIPFAVVGTVGGTLFAWLLLKVFVPVLTTQIPRIESAGLNAPVLAFAIGVSWLVVLLAALLPARVAGRFHIAAATQPASRSITAGTTARNMLVIAQVTMTIVLLFASALLARSLAGVLRVDPGFRTDGALTLQLAVTRATRPDDAQIADYYDRIADRLRGVPGVVAAGFVNRLPLSGIDQTGPVQFEGKPDMPVVDTDWRSATPAYFAAAGIPLKRGRVFTSFDRPDSPRVALIDEQLARKVFGDEDPVGRRVRIPLADQPWTEIVGVVGHIFNATPEKDVRPQIYWPESQRTQDRAALVIRTAGRPEAFSSVVIDQIRKEDPDQPVYDVRTFDAWMSQTLGTRHLMTWLVAFFGGASLLLASLGLYGVVAYTSGLRMREFGIRLALGASRHQIRRLVLSQAGTLVLLGCAAGLAMAFPVGRALQSLLYNVTSADVVSLFVAPTLLIAVTFLASAGPARRAARTDPAVTLRVE
jgi:predicted permease